MFDLDVNNKLSFVFQQFGKILDVEIIFNERGSKVSYYLYFTASYITSFLAD